jgi:hypothetical protein
VAGLIIVVVTFVGGLEDGGDVVASPSSAGGGGVRSIFTRIPMFFSVTKQVLLIFTYSHRYF